MESVALFRDEHGNINQDLLGANYVVPARVEFLPSNEEGNLRWSYQDMRQEPPAPLRYVRPRSDMLVDFVKLSEGTSEQILSYAKKWGPLYICKHDLPASHSYRMVYHELVEYPTGSRCHHNGYDTRDEGEGPWWDGYEPLPIWRRYSQQAAAMLRIAANFHQNVPGSVKDWKLLDRPFTDFPIEQQRSWLANLLQMDWLEISELHFALTWRDTVTPRISFQGRLFSQLALQLAGLVGRTQGVAFCDYCGNLHVPQYRSSGGSGPKFTARARNAKKHYCLKCREDGVGVSEAQRASRARKKYGALLAQKSIDQSMIRQAIYEAETPEQREKCHVLWLLGRGMTIDEIADAVEWESSKVRDLAAAFERDGPSAPFLKYGANSRVRTYYCYLLLA